MKKRLALALLLVGILVLLIGCSGILSALFGSTVTLSLSCPGEVVDGVGTDENWRVSLDDGSRRTLYSSRGDTLEFEDVEHGEHTLYFTPPAGCYDLEVAYYDFEVDGDEELDLSTYDLTIMSGIYSVRSGARAKE